MLTEEQKTQVQAAAVEAFDANKVRVKDSGGIMTETEGGRIKLSYLIGAETYQPIPAFPKANLADNRWVDRLFRNQDATLTKAQVEAAVVEAVRDLLL